LQEGALNHDAHDKELKQIGAGEQYMSYDVIAMIQAIIDGTSPGQAPPYAQTMGLNTDMRFTEVSYGRFVLIWTIGKQLSHHDEFVQGGIVSVVADTGQSMAFWSTSTEEESYSTADLSTRFFRPMKVGESFRVESIVLNRSRRMGVVETRFIGVEDGKIYALVTGSWMLAKRNFGG
jgi:uncharacterized protein (TIGR00369 family)